VLHFRLRAGDRTAERAAMLYPQEDTQTLGGSRHCRWQESYTILIPENSFGAASTTFSRNTSETLESAFKPLFRSLAAERLVGRAMLQLCSNRQELRISALLDCFGEARSDPRFFIVLRYLLPMLQDKSLEVALTLLAHVTPHPDIWWSENNWIPEQVADDVRPCLCWSLDEIKRLLSDVGWGRWQRGDVGEDLYMLLQEDPQIQQKVEKVAVESLWEGRDDAAWIALYLVVYWAGRRGSAKYEQLVSAAPGFRELPLSRELEYQLGEQGCVFLFE
jgi:hypothetical protein